jgi:hypothetical protein
VFESVNRSPGAICPPLPAVRSLTLSTRETLLFAIVLASPPRE